MASCRHASAPLAVAHDWRRPAGGGKGGKRKQKARWGERDDMGHGVVDILQACKVASTHGAAGQAWQERRGGRCEAWGHGGSTLRAVAQTFEEVLSLPLLGPLFVITTWAIERAPCCGYPCVPLLVRHCPRSFCFCRVCFFESRSRPSLSK